MILLQHFLPNIDSSSSNFTWSIRYPQVFDPITFIMRFIHQILATLALGSVLSVMAAPVDANAIDVRDARPPSDLKYADDFIHQNSKS